jgi:23S rRNA pseudouridine2605 synthase
MLHKKKSYLDNSSKKTVLLALHKPKGFICTHKDEFNRKKAIDLIPKKTLKTINGTIHSVGRLDYNSQGLLLLTNNTKIKRFLESPNNRIIRTYKVKVQGIIDNNALAKIKKGLLINKIYYKVKNIKEIDKSRSYSWFIIKLDEGKNNHIRKIFLKLGFSVNKLIRIQYGPIKLSSLKSGELKFISPFKLNLKDL